MGVNASRVRFQLDAADAVTLRDVADGAETADAKEAAVSLNELRSAYWHNKEIPHGVMAVTVHVTAINGDAAGTVVYLEVDDVEAHDDSPVRIASMTVSTAGVYTMFVDSKSIPGLDSDADGTGKYLAIGVDVPGVGAPSITYGAWIARNVHP